MNALGKLDDYFQAVSSARKVHKLSTVSAIRSVVEAKLGYGIGPRMHALFSLAGIPVSEWKHFQHHKELEAVLKQLNPESGRNVTSDKILFSRHCEVHGIVHTQTIYHDQPDQDLSDAERWENFSRCIEPVSDPLFFKLMDGEHGYGAFRAERSNDCWSYCGETGSTGDLYEFCRKRQGTRRGWVVQAVLETHTELQQITSARGLTTARILTCMDPEGPAIMFALLKMARGQNHTDNFHQGLTGNMVAEIEIDSGRLGPAKGSLSRKFPCISSFDADPDTGQKITGRVVPFWEETKALILQAQSTLPELKSLGWDVAITDQGPCVVEANTNYASELMEVAYGRGLKPVFINRLNQLI